MSDFGDTTDIEGESPELKDRTTPLIPSQIT